MTKVEELRERLIQAIGTYGVAEDKGMPSELCETLDSLIAAARAEGAEQEAAKIVHCGECASAKPYSDEPMVECRFGCDRPDDGFCSLGTLLAPATKEADRGNS